MENIPKQKQRFSKAELKKASEVLDKIFPPYEETGDEERQDCAKLIKWNRLIF